MTRCLTCSLLIVLTACKTTTSTPQQTMTVKPSALIGTAYDAVTDEFTGVSCLDISSLTADDYTQRSPGSFKIEERQSVDENELRQVFGSFQKTFYNPATGLRLSRPYEMVQRLLENESEDLTLRIIQSDSAHLSFAPAAQSKLRLSREAETMVQQILIAEGAERAQLIDIFVQTCGTGFLSGMNYKLGMMASLRWIWANPSDKKRWAATLRAFDRENWNETHAPLPVLRVRYESHMKETREISLRTVGDSGSKDCAPDALRPCLDAYRLFANATIPAWQRMVKRSMRDFDSVLPLAFLSEPAVIPYAAIEPALAPITLAPSEAESAAWHSAREAYIDLYARVYRKILMSERALAADKAQAYQALLQKISSDAAACYRPLLDRSLCIARREALQKEWDGL